MQLLSVIAASLPGLAALGALLFTWMQVGQASKELRISEHGQITSRFNAAVGNLGSQSLDIRLGGIYALERIMQDSARDHPTVVSVLAAFAKRHAGSSTKSLKEPRGAPVTLEADVLAALATLAHRRPERDRGTIIDLAGTDLRGLSFTGKAPIRLPEVELVWADLRRAWLPGVDLRRASMHKTNLNYAWLWGANLREAVLEGASLAETNLASADLRRAYMSCADYSGVEHCVDLHSASLRNADLRNAEMWGANLSHADAEDVDLRGADLTRSDLSNAELGVADVRDATLIHADLRNAYLWGADFRGADLSNANLSNANLSNADFRGAELTGANLKGANRLGTRGLPQEG